MIELNKIYNEDCLEGMKKIPDKSIDFCCTDLPFGITGCEWDKKINLEKFWEQVNRILKPTSSTAMFAISKFAYELQASNTDRYKYEWVWVKNQASLFVHAKNRPMTRHEKILIFSEGSINHKSLSPNTRMKYFPQGVRELTEKERHRWNAARKKFGNVFGPRPSHAENYQSTKSGYPSDVLFFEALNTVKKINPTQKPVELIEYLIKTYTNEGETVLDACMGSGTTAIAAINTGRNFIGFELDENFYNKANERIANFIAEKELQLF